MKINSKAFLDAAALPIRLAAKRNPLPVLNSLRLAASGGRVSVIGSNLDMFAEALIDCEGDLEPVCVSASSLAKLLAGLGESVELRIKGKRVFISGQHTAELALMAGDEMPKFPDSDGPDFGVSCHDLASAIKAVSWSCSSDASDFVLSCVWINTGAKSLECASADRTQAAYVHLPSIAADVEALLPLDQANTLASVLEMDGAAVSFQESYVFARHSAGRVAVKRAEGTYPRVRNAVKSKGVLGDFDVKALCGVLKLACAAATADWMRVSLTFSASGLELVLKDPNSAFRGSVPGKFAEARMDFDASRLIRLLEHCPQPTAQAHQRAGNGLLIQCGDLSLGLAEIIDRK